MSADKEIQELESLIGIGYNVPGFRLVRDPYSQLGEKIIQRIGFLVGDPGRSPSEDQELNTLIKTLEYFGIETGWEPVPIQKDLERKDKPSLNELVEYKDARIYYAILALDEMNSSTPQQQTTILEAVKAHLIDAYSGKLNK